MGTLGKWLSLSCGAASRLMAAANVLYAEALSRGNPKWKRCFQSESMPGRRPLHALIPTAKPVLNYAGLASVDPCQCNASTVLMRVMPQVVLQPWLCCRDLNPVGPVDVVTLLKEVALQVRD